MTTVYLFPDEPSAARPAWQVIDAAREMRLTGELTLPTQPMTRVFLRDGIPYFAERATDGGLGIRLVLEGVLTRAQLSNGTVLVNGVEHLGRLFERDQTVDRDAVELCVEMFTDDVLTQMADDLVDTWQIALYKRHPSGIDRWYPHVTRVLTRVVERQGPAVEVAPVAAPVTAPVETPVVETPVVEAPVVETPVVETPVVEAPVVEAPVVETPAAETPVEAPAVEAPVEAPAVEAPVVEIEVEAPPVEVVAGPAPAPRSSLPAPTTEQAAIVRPPVPTLSVTPDMPTDVVPVQELDALLQPRLATGQQPVVETAQHVDATPAEPEVAAAPQPEPVIARRPPTEAELADLGSGDNLAEDIAEAIRRTMAAYETQSA